MVWVICTCELYVCQRTQDTGFIPSMGFLIKILKQKHKEVCLRVLFVEGFTRNTIKKYEIK